MEEAASIDYLALRRRLRKDLITEPSPERVRASRKECEVAAENAPRREDRAVFCQILAQHCSNYAESRAAYEWLDEAERLSKGKPQLEASTAYVRASLLYRERRASEAREVVEKYIDAVDASVDVRLAARMNTMYAGILDSLGEVEMADAAFTKARALRERVGDEAGLAVVFYNYAEFCAQRDDDARALDFFMKAYTIEKHLGLQSQMAQSACQISLLYASRNNRPDAERFFTEATSAANASGVPNIVALTKANAASLYERLGDHTARLSALLEAKTYLDRYPFDSIRSMVLGNLASVYIEQERFGEAEPLLEQAMKLSRKLDHKYAIGYWLFMKGLLRSRQERFEEAIPLLSEAVNTLSDVNAHVYTLKAFAELAKAHSETGNTAIASKLLAEWATRYIDEHNAEVDQRIRRLADSKERERQVKEDEIYRLRNVELSQAMDNLKEANTELHDLASEKDEFMAIAAHDLRNTLADMRSMLTTVINSVDVLEKSDIVDFCKDLLATTTRMSATVHAFLEISRNDRRTSGILKETVDLVHLAHRALERHVSRAESKNISVVVKGTGQVWAEGDASIVDAVLDNMLSNAMKFSPKGSTITIDVVSTDDRSLIRVIDDGPGIGAADRAKLFTKYGRLSNKPTGGEDSLGLGLYLAKRMAERMNGRLEYDDAEGGGSCFTLTCRRASKDV